MTTATATDPLLDVLNATLTWQQRAVAEVVPLHQEQLRAALAIEDPEDRRLELEKVVALSSLDSQYLERISAQRIQAYQMLEGGNRDKAIRNLRAITTLVQESGLPGLAMYVVDVRNKVEELETRMSSVEGKAQGALDGVGLLQRQLNALQQEVVNMKQQPSNTQVSDASTKAQRSMSGAEAATRAFGATVKNATAKLSERGKPPKHDGGYRDFIPGFGRKPEHAA